MAKKKPQDETQEELEMMEEAEKDDQAEKEVDDQPAEELESTPEQPKPAKASAVRAKKGGKKAVKPKSNTASIEPEVANDNTLIQRPVQSKKKLAIVLGVIGLVLIVSAAAGYMLLGRESGETSNSNTNSVSSTSDSRVPRRIDGVLDTVEHQNKYPVAVMVENHTQARPQSGLDEANIVYEALAEGGITRFLGVFALTNEVDEIGPVRSARPYYVDWARGYNALYAHAGGSPKGLARITTVGLPDLNQFFNSQYYYRDTKRKVASEHTLYTTSTLLSRALLDKKLPATGTYEAWAYKADAAPSDRASSQHVTIDFSSFSYKVDYEYSPVTNTYARSMAEQPHVMRNGAKIEPKNIVVIRVKRTLEDPKDSHGRLTLDDISSGVASFYLDGKEIKGTWKKTSAQDGLKLFDADGSPMKLNAGQTWVEVVPPEQAVTVK